MAIVKLKRARNSLLNISTLPPEILGDIFHWNVIVTGDFGGLKERSHNFLLVCHHWFEVASHTPELWSFWGNNLRDWRKRHLRYPTAPLDLVLNERWTEAGTLDYSLTIALQRRAERDAVRQIHLASEDSELLDSIMSSLIANYEGIQPNNVESFLLRDESDDGTSVDVSDFFAYSRFPNLRRLELLNCTISSWDLITSRTSVLTILILNFSYPSPAPTTPQLLSILESNPALQELSLSGCAIPDDGGNKSSFRVPLHHLRELELTGDLRHVFGLLHRLDHPQNMDYLSIDLQDCTTDDVPQVIGPYLRNYLRRRGRSRGGLGLFLSTEYRFVLHVGDVDGVDFSAVGPVWMVNFVVITIDLIQIPPNDLLGEVALDLIENVPREDVVYFHADGGPVAMEGVSVQFPYLKALHFEGMLLHIAFPEPTPGRDRKVFPSLQRITLDQVVVRRGDWSPLTSFLAHRASSENVLDILEIIGSYKMRPGVEESIRRGVREFRMIDEPDDDHLSSL